MESTSFKCFHLLKLGNDIWISIIELYFLFVCVKLIINRRLALEMFFIRTYLRYKMSFIYFIKRLISPFFVSNSCLWNIILEWKVYVQSLVEMYAFILSGYNKVKDKYFGQHRVIFPFCSFKNVPYDLIFLKFSLTMEA